MQACRVADISARTIERWRKDPEGDDARRGPQHRPGNALTSTEEAQIVGIMRSSRFAHLSPKQLVPRYEASIFDCCVKPLTDNCGDGAHDSPQVGETGQLAQKVEGS